MLNYPQERWRVVINRSILGGLLLSEVERSWISSFLVEFLPAETSRLYQSGKPIVLDNARHPVSASITTFAKQHVAVAPSVNGNSSSTKKAADEREGAAHIMTLADRLAQARRDRATSSSAAASAAGPVARRAVVTLSLS